MRSIKHFNTAFENICQNVSVHKVLVFIIKFQILMKDDIYIRATIRFLYITPRF